MPYMDHISLLQLTLHYMVLVQICYTFKQTDASTKIKNKRYNGSSDGSIIFLDKDNIIILNIIIEPETPLYLYLLYITPIYGDQNEVVMNFITISLYSINGITSNSSGVINQNDLGKITRYTGKYDFTAYYIENPT